MFKISKKASTVLSDFLTGVLLGILVVGVFFLPSILRFFTEVFEKPAEYYAPTLIILYAALLPAFAADGALHFLLKNVREGRIFTEQSVKYLRILSLCCILECLIFFALGFYYVMVFLLSFAALFMGVVLHVVKNVIEEAAEIKEENDFTV